MNSSVEEEFIFFIWIKAVVPQYENTQYKLNLH